MNRLQWADPPLATHGWIGDLKSQTVSTAGAAKYLLTLPEMVDALGLEPRTR